MINTTEALPYPFDPARPLRDANRARVDLIYQAALKQAERTAQSSAHPSTWPLQPDVIRVAVQPVAPSSRLISPKDLGERAHALRDEPIGSFFTGSATPVPLGILWSDFYVAGNDRNAQIVLENGLVCHIGQALLQDREDQSGFYPSHLMIRIILSVQVAHQLHKEHVPEEGMALSVAVENLGQYALVNARGIPMSGGASLIENWTWNYHIPAAIFGDKAQLNELILMVMEEVHWGLGDAQINRQNLLNMAKQQDLSLGA